MLIVLIPFSTDEPPYLLLCTTHRDISCIGDKAAQYGPSAPDQLPWKSGIRND